jgi:methionyl-tRNA formyltransferase
MNNRIEVVVLSSKLPEDIWLINKIAEVSHIKGIVFPVGERYKEFGVFQVLKKRLRRSGFLSTADQALLILYRLIFESQKDKRAVREIFTDKPYQYVEEKGIDTICVEDINCEEVRNFILSKSPRLIVVSGTPLLRKRTIALAKGRIINLHPGYAPQYRGRYGAFWPIYNQEPELVGVTVHFLDSGIDTGAILMRKLVDYSPGDNLKTIAYRQHKVGGEILVRCLAEFEEMARKAYHDTHCPSKNYLAPGLTHYLKAKRWLRSRTRGEKLVSSS